MYQYELCELSFSGETPERDWAAAAPEAVLQCGACVHRVRGFVDGAGQYRVRFLPEVPGIWQYRVGQPLLAEGAVEVLPARPGHHGKVRTEDCHFVHQDGSFFYPFGTTVYALLHQEPELVEQTLQTLESGPFNKVRFCVFPKHYDFNHNTPPSYPFAGEADHWRVQEPNFPFWQNLERVLLRLGSAGIECDLILFHPYDRWGFSRFCLADDLRYLDYLLRRLAAFPNVWWSMANEYDLFPEKSTARWEAIEEFLSENDSFHHLLSNHNCFCFWDAGRPRITHASLQTKMFSRIGQWRRQYHKPICVDECCYEGNLTHPWGSISARELTFRFWRTVVLGGYCTHGETYYHPEDILWWSRGGKLHGESPSRIGFLRQIVEDLPGPICPMEPEASDFLFLPPQKQQELLQSVPESEKPFLRGLCAMGTMEAMLYLSAEPTYAGHVGEEAYLIFYDLRTPARGELTLPETKRYRLEWLDVWNMTRAVLAEDAHGKVTFPLPAQEGIAVLATALRPAP